jgi:hypothetical protein
MKKGVIIKKIIGEVLCPLGFTFRSINGMSLWIFERSIISNEGENIKQEVHIQKSTSTDSLYFRIKTNAYGHMPIYNVDHIIPGCKSNQISYKNDDEFVRCIEYFSKGMQEYGIKLLERISEPTVIDRPRGDDQLYLYNNHEQLTEDFISKEGICIEISQDELIGTIFRNIVEVAGSQYSEVRELLLSLAAFYGDWILAHAGSGEWVFSEAKYTTIKFYWGSLFMIFPVLESIFSCLLSASKEKNEEERYKLIKGILTI